jgi:hypothetical protein
MPTPRKYATAAERQAAYRQRQEAARRAALEAKNMPATAPISTMPSLSRWKALKEQAQAILQTMLEEMEAYRDERSEQWQESDKGAAFEEMIDQVDTARNSVEEIAFE